MAATDGAWVAENGGHGIRYFHILRELAETPQPQSSEEPTSTTAENNEYVRAPEDHMYWIGRGGRKMYPRNSPDWWTVICDQIAVADVARLSIDLRQDGFLPVRPGEPISRECFKSFCRKLKHVKSIQVLELSDCLYGGATFRWLGRLFEKCPSLKDLMIRHDPSFDDASNTFVDTLLSRKIDSLKNIYLNFTGITDNSVGNLIRGFQACPSLEVVDLDSNHIERMGCLDLAYWLQDPACKLKKLGIWENPIGYEGTLDLIDTLAINEALKTLSFDARYVEEETPEEDFDETTPYRLWRPFKVYLLTILCSAKSIHATLLSNHTIEKLHDVESDVVTPLEILGDSVENLDNEVNALLQLNMNPNKAQVAIQKILLRHEDFDMGPLFEWDLKVLPYMLRWFGRAKECPDVDEGDINNRTLSAVFQFARSTPLMFVPGDKHKKGSRARRKTL